MTDLICRCGEPWDSTRGLHHTHSDLPWWEYEQLVRGLGCPSCAGEFDQTPENDEAWRNSVQYLANGSCEGGEPYPGFPLSVAPYWHKGTYRDSSDEPAFSELQAPKGGWGYIELFFNDLTPSPAWKRGYDSDDDDSPILWFEAPGDHFAGGAAMADGSDITREVNAEVLYRELLDHNHIYTSSNGRIYIGMAQCSCGKLEPFTIPLGGGRPGQRVQVAQRVQDFLSALNEDPCLDDLRYAERQAECRVELVSEWLDEYKGEIAAAFGMEEDDVAPALQNTSPNKFSISARFFTDYPNNGKAWEGETPEPEALITKFFDEAARPPLGWRIVQTIEPEIWMVIPKIPGMEELTTFPGYSVRSSGHITWVWGMPANQLKWTAFGNLSEAFWSHLPQATRRAINEALSDDGDSVDVEDETPKAFL